MLAGALGSLRVASNAAHSAELFLADMGNHRIQVFEAATGTHRRSFGSKGSRAGEFNKPNGLAIVRGRLAVSEFLGKRIQIVACADGATHLTAFVIVGAARLAGTRRPHPTLLR